MNHFISLDAAIKMTAYFRVEKENILLDTERGKNLLPICETFEVAPFIALLAQPGCVSIRLYYSMDTEKKVHAVFVGVNNKNEDMLPGHSTEIDNSNIIEEGLRCPPMCPPASALNS